eukprot:178031-Pelagomonas_calceolata.AAC.3
MPGRREQDLELLSTGARGWNGMQGEHELHLFLVIWRVVAFISPRSTRKGQWSGGAIPVIEGGGEEGRDVLQAFRAGTERQCEKTLPASSCTKACMQHGTVGVGADMYVGMPRPACLTPGHTVAQLPGQLALP